MSVPSGGDQAQEGRAGGGGEAEEGGQVFGGGEGVQEQGRGRRSACMQRFLLLILPFESVIKLQSLHRFKFCRSVNCVYSSWSEWCPCSMTCIPR